MCLPINADVSTSLAPIIAEILQWQATLRTARQERPTEAPCDAMCARSFGAAD